MTTENNMNTFSECYACHPLALTRSYAYHGHDSYTEDCLGCAMVKAAKYEIPCKEGCNNKESRDTMRLITANIVKNLANIRDAECRARSNYVRTFMFS